VAPHPLRRHQNDPRPKSAAVAAGISAAGSGADVAIDPLTSDTVRAFPFSSDSEVAGLRNASVSRPPGDVELIANETWARPKVSPGFTVRNPGAANSESEAVNWVLGKVSCENGPPPRQ
jgi:hypothetical protein